MRVLPLSSIVLHLGGRSVVADLSTHRDKRSMNQCGALYTHRATSDTDVYIPHSTRRDKSFFQCRHVNEDDLVSRRLIRSSEVDITHYIRMKKYVI